MKHIPFLLRPVGKDYLWGGERLKTEYHKQIDLTPLAETWECSTHPDGCSVVDSGAAAGKPLRTVLQEHPEYLGIYANPEGELPILIKLIDAKKDLSVQDMPHSPQISSGSTSEPNPNCDHFAAIESGCPEQQDSASRARLHWSNHHHTKSIPSWDKSVLQSNIQNAPTLSVPYNYKRPSIRK